MISNTKNMALDNEALHRMAPSIFAATPHPTRVSEKYTFIPTTRVLDDLRTNGWFPVSARENWVRKADRKGYQSHMIRFRRDTGMLDVGDVVPELVLRNSHDGLSAYVFEAGLFRCVCKNQMVVSDGLFQRIGVKHIGAKSDDIIEASYRVLEDLPKITGSVQAMKAVVLSRSEQEYLAEGALFLKYGDANAPEGTPMVAPIKSTALLTVKRQADVEPTLWNTLNTLQENVIRGGLKGTTAKKRRTTTRAVQSISEDIRLNKALWTLAEAMKGIKTAA